jgi:hypothetical protein
MAGSPPTPTLIDVIVLVFAKSELRELVGTDALRSVLEGQQRALFPELDTMDLQPLYELLEGQPGFDAEKAISPFCRLKTWEAQLKVKVRMPVALEVLDSKTRDIMSMNVNAFDSDLDKLLRPATPKTPVSMTRMIESGSAARSKANQAGNSRVKIAFAVASLALVAAGISAYFTFSTGGGNTKHLSATELTEQIPLAHVRQSGDVIVATLKETSWLDRPEIERRAQLEPVVIKMALLHARTLVLVDQKGITLGTISRRGAPVISFVPRK